MGYSLIRRLSQTSDRLAKRSFQRVAKEEGNRPFREKHSSIRVEIGLGQVGSFAGELRGGRVLHTTF